MATLQLKQRSVLPGFGLSMGYTLLYLSLIVLVPLSALFIKTTRLDWSEFWQIVTSRRLMHAYKLTFGTAFVAASVNAVFGFIVAWSLVRYRFPGKRLIDAMVDLPFALPTAVSGIALTAIYSPTGWIGRYFSVWNNSSLLAWLAPKYAALLAWLGSSWLGILTAIMPSDLVLKGAYSSMGIGIALTFIGLPFVVRTLQPALEELEPEIEEAASSLGATRWQTFRRIILPAILPALLTGFALAFARALGEYGSVVFIAGNLPGKTEVVTLMIMTYLNEHEIPSATAIATVMLVASFFLLLLINLIQWWSTRRHRGG